MQVTVTVEAFRDRLRQSHKRVDAVVLAGGLARRMQGQDKGLIELGGKAMVSWVVASVSPVVDSVIVNANRNADAYVERLLLDTGRAVELVEDSHSGYVGPLAGLSAALHHSQAEHVFMCPCDSPFISSELPIRLVSMALEQDADVAVAHDGERLQPVFCVANRRVLASLDEYLESGERKIDRWYASLNQYTVDCNDMAGSFRNINTEEERLTAESELTT